MRYFAKFISADGLSKSQRVSEMKEYVYRAACRSLRCAVTQPATLDFTTMQTLRREYKLYDFYRVKEDLTYLVYKEII